MRPHRRPRDVNDHFRAGSTTKMMIATVVLQLEQEGRLDIDDPIPAWLQTKIGNGCNIYYTRNWWEPALCWTGPNAPSQMTIKSLLNHTSGLGSYDVHATFMARIGPELMSEDGQSPHFSLDDLLGAGVTHGPIFSPNRSLPPCSLPACRREEKRKLVYSNTNYVALAMIIENLTSKSYSQNITERIIQPLGLSETSMPGYRTTPLPAQPDAPGHTPVANDLPAPHSEHYSGLKVGTADSPFPLGVFNTTRFDYTLASAAGDQISTTGDLIKLLRGVLSGQLLGSAQKAEMFAVPATDNVGDLLEGDLGDLEYAYSDGGTYLDPAVAGTKVKYGLGISQRRFVCAGTGEEVTVWGHNGFNPGSLSYVYGKADGSKVIAFNLNVDFPSRHMLDSTGTPVANKYDPAEITMLYQALRAYFC